MNQFNLFPKLQLEAVMNSIMNEAIVNKDYKDEYRLRIAITNSTLSPNSAYHIHSLDRFNCGDMFLFEGQHYLVISDTVLKRHAKYKATAEYCNAPLEYWELEKKETGRDDLDRPVYKKEWKLKRLEYAVQRKETNISVDSNQAINLFDYRYEFRIRDIIENVETYKTNTEIRVNGHWFKVIEARRLKNGLLNVSVKDSSEPNGFPKDR